MSVALPLAVALPMLAAALLGAVGSHLPPRVVQLVAVGVAAATTATCVVVLLDAWPHETVHWFGGWTPTDGHAFGIAFSANGLDAALAVLAALITTAALVFAIAYYEQAGHLFHVLMLVFLAGLVGFSLTGDLFNMFVFFELMSVSGYALCGYNIEQPSVLQGALAFAIVNSVGAFFVVMGLTLTYAKTGALNLAQIGAELSKHAPDQAIVIAFALLLVGFLVKAGAAPFHFWLSDAYAVAPAPAGALFAGVMSDVAFHAVARIYWTCFSGSVGGHAHVVRDLLIVVGISNAVVGAVMCVLQAETKRQLAFLVVSHGGAFLTGYALLSADGLAATTSYVVTDGLLKAALFLGLGAVVTRVGGTDELRLHGRGRTRAHVPLGVLVGLAAAAMVLPGIGTWLPAHYLYWSAQQAGYGWIPVVLTVTGALTAGTMLRSTARIFLGWGTDQAPFLTRQRAEQTEDEPNQAPPPSSRLLAPAYALLAIALVAVWTPGLLAHARHLAQSFVDLPGTVDELLHGHVPPPPRHLRGYTPSLTAVFSGAIALLLACGVAALGLWWSSLPAILRRGFATLERPVSALKAAHSGAIGDYVAWVTGGAVGVTLVASFALR